MSLLKQSDSDVSNDARVSSAQSKTKRSTGSSSATQSSTTSRKQSTSRTQSTSRDRNPSVITSTQRIREAEAIDEVMEERGPVSLSGARTKINAGCVMRRVPAGTTTHTSSNPEARTTPETQDTTASSPDDLDETFVTPVALRTR